MLFKANINSEHPMRHRQRMHAVGNMLAKLQSIVLSHVVQPFRRFQRLLMMQINRQRQGFEGIGLIVQLLLFLQQRLIVIRQLFRGNVMLTRQ